MSNRILAVPALACVAGLAVGCGGAAVPASQRTDAVAAVRSAHEVGAERTPQASYHLALADEQMEQAEALISQGRMEQAARVLERAKADAELAIALEHEAQVHAHATEIHEHIDEQRESHLGMDEE